MDTILLLVKPLSAWYNSNVKYVKMSNYSFICKCIIIKSILLLLSSVDIRRVINLTVFFDVVVDKGFLITFVTKL